MCYGSDLYYRKKEFRKVLNTFKEALKVKPEDVMILNNYAYYLAEQGQELKEAERMAKLVDRKRKGKFHLSRYLRVDFIQKRPVQRSTKNYGNDHS